MNAVHQFADQFVRELKNLPKLLPADERRRDALFAFVLSLVWMIVLSGIWPESSGDNLLVRTLKSPFLGFVVSLGSVRLARLYLQTPRGQPRRDWTRSTAPKVAYFLLYAIFVIAGSAALIRFDTAILQKLQFATRYAIVVPLGFPAFIAVLMLSLRLRQWLTRTGQSHTETRSLSLPDADNLNRLAEPLTLRIKDLTRKILLWFAWSYAAGFVVFRALLSFKLWDDGFESSLFFAVITLWSGVAALMMGIPARPRGHISKTYLRPRFGRDFRWSEVARVEEERKWSDLNEKGAFSLIFRDSKGAKLWQFPLGDINENELCELKRLFPDLN